MLKTIWINFKGSLLGNLKGPEVEGASVVETVHFAGQIDGSGILFDSLVLILLFCFCHH